MNKLDLTITNNIKIDNKNIKNINLDIIDLFYTLYKNNLVYDPDNFNFVNKDKVIVSKSLEKIYTDILKIFYKDTNSKYEYCLDDNYNFFGTALGLALGNRYIDNLFRLENNKYNYYNNRVICICKYDELLSTLAFDTISYVNSEKLNKMVFIVIKDSFDKCQEDLVDRFSYLKFNIDEVNGISKLNSILEDTKTSKIPSIVFINLKNSRQLPTIKENVDLSSIHALVSKRVNKDIVRWDNFKKNSQKDIKVKEIIDFLEAKKVIINFKGSNIKLDDNYEETILQSNNKIFNLINKHNFILNLSDTLDICTISKAKNMDKSNPLGRNIILENRLPLLGGISIGLAYSGFKVFVNTHLNHLKDIFASIVTSSNLNLNIHYLFLESEDSINYIDTLNYVNNLLTFRPCDINEVIGTYEVIKEYNKPTAVFVSNVKVKEVKGTNYKYVQAGSYPVKKESDSVNGILIASGFNVINAITIANGLVSLGIILRVVSMPAPKVFDMQNAKYQSMLIPNTKIFVLDSGNSIKYKRFVKNNEFVLNDYNIEANKAKIIELMKK